MERQLFLKKNETAFISKRLDQDLDKFLNNDVKWIFLSLIIFMLIGGIFLLVINLPMLITYIN